MSMLDLDCDGPPMTIAPANGFPPLVYNPLMAPFQPQYCVMSIPPRALMDGQQVPDSHQSWKDTLAADMIASIQRLDLHDMIAVGHSFGGVATLLSAIAVPERFKAIILLDPTILPEDILRGMRAMQVANDHSGNVLAERASRRRTHFDSHDDAYTYFKGKRLFADWPDETVRLYAESMVPDGDEVRLAWPREWEAYYFRTMYTHIWDELPALAATEIPLLVIRGGTSDTFVEQAADRMATIIPNATYKVVDGHGHLFPQSAPDETQQIMQDWLSAV